MFWQGCVLSLTVKLVNFWNLSRRIMQMILNPVLLIVRGSFRSISDSRFLQNNSRALQIFSKYVIKFPAIGPGLFCLGQNGGFPAHGAGTGMCRFAARECTPHFLWLRQRKRAVHGPKEKRFLVSTVGPSGQLWTDGRWWLDVPPSPEIFCRVRYTGYEGRSACPHLGGLGTNWG